MIKSERSAHYFWCHLENRQRDKLTCRKYNLLVDVITSVKVGIYQVDKASSMQDTVFY